MTALRGPLRRCMYGLWLTGCLMLVAQAMTVQAAAQIAAPSLWTQRDMPPGLTPAPEVLSSIAVEVQVGVLRTNQRLSLTMPDGGQLHATRSRLVNTAKGLVWMGTIDNQSISSAGFSVVNQALAGSILTGTGRSFRLRLDASGVYLLEEIDLRKLPPEGQAPGPSGPRKYKLDNEPALETCSTDSGDEIDLMVVYTTDARVGAGGTDVIEADIQLAVEQANQSYINSDVAQRLRLVHLAEVSYTESGKRLTDLGRLQSGLIGNVHSLRNSHGADVVALITESLDDCGLSFQMEAVGNAFEGNAFSVVKRVNCMSTAGKHSLAHELGHLMGARHDWKVDGHFTPFVFSHGHVAVEPITGPPWRTVMAYDALCQEKFVACPRVMNWSNPNVSLGGSPTGVDGGSEPQDNHRALNKTARTVANFRCSSPGRSDVWMKDTWADTGTEPDPAQAAQPMWESPYIWVRNAQDSQLVHQHKHQNPVGGQPNFVYVKLHNGGAATSGQLEVRVVNATLGVSWPGTWTSLPSAPVAVAMAANTSRIVELPWTPPALGGHYCLLARWISTSDPMTTPEGSDIEVNVRSNNNIVWRNIQLIDLGGGDANADAAFEVPGVGAGRSFVLAIRPLPTRRPGGPRVPGFMDFGRIMLTLDDRLMQAWKRSSYQSSGLRRDGSTIIVTDPKGAQLTLGAVQEAGQARILFSRPKTAAYARAEFGWRVTQSPANEAKSQARGGVTYQVRTLAP